MPLELEQEGACVLLKVRVSIGLQYMLNEGVGIQKVRVLLASPNTIAQVVGIFRNGEFLSHLGTHFEVFRDLLEVTQQLIGRGRPVKGRVIADRAKEWLAFVKILTKLA